MCFYSSLARFFLSLLLFPSLGDRSHAGLDCLWIFNVVEDDLELLTVGDPVWLGMEPGCSCMSGYNSKHWIVVCAHYIRVIHSPPKDVVNSRCWQLHAKPRQTVVCRLLYDGFLPYLCAKQCRCRIVWRVFDFCKELSSSSAFHGVTRER